MWHEAERSLIGWTIKVGRGTRHVVDELIRIFVAKIKTMSQYAITAAMCTGSRTVMALM
jgi:hypothetical protein